MADRYYVRCSRCTWQCKDGMTWVRLWKFAELVEMDRWPTDQQLDCVANVWEGMVTLVEIRAE